MSGISNLADATGAFIEAFSDWRYFGTFTFRRTTSEHVGARQLRRMLRCTAMTVFDDHVAFAIGGGPHELGGWHYHVLFGPCENSRGIPYSGTIARQIEYAWRSSGKLAGHSRVLKYDPMRGAAFYLAQHDEWDLNVACPRRPKCRRSRCILAPTAW